MFTDRLELRLPVEADRSRFVKLGFEFWQLCEVNGFEDDLYRKTFG